MPNETSTPDSFWDLFAQAQQSLAKADALHHELLVKQCRMQKAATNSISRFLRALALVWVNHQVVNQPTLIWMMEECANRNMGKLPFYQKFPIEDGKVTGEITDDLTMGFLVWMNLLETGDINSPVPTPRMREIMLGLNTQFEKLDRKTPLLEAGAFDEDGNVSMPAVEQSAVEWVKVSKGTRPF